MRVDTPRSWGGIVVERDNVAQLADRPKPGDSKWMDPRFLVAMLALIIGMVVNYWSSHSADAARAAKTDAALTVIMQQAADMKGSQSRIEGSVQAVTNVAITLQAKVEAQAREISDMKEDIKTHNVFVVKITNDIAKLQAKMEK